MIQSKKILSGLLGFNDPSWIRFLTRWLLLSLALHLVAGVMSTGFYDMDEHFQVMEFLSYKLGRTPLTHLAPEFFEQDRSWLQPTFYELFARAWMAVGVVSPAIWAASFRVISSLLGWVSLVGMSVCSYSWFSDRKYKELAVKLSALLYFLPYLHARTASENLSGSLFFIAVALFILFSMTNKSEISDTLDVKYENPSSFLAIGIGFLLGLAFSCRFQMAFMILGFGIWCLFIARTSVHKLSVMAFGFAAAVGLEILLDFRGYGVWTFAPWNYFRVAILEGKAATTGGAYPWWYYFKILSGDVPLLGNFFAAVIFLGWFHRPTHLLSFSTMPFFIAHVFLAHKEPRYLFPLVSGVPVLLTFGFEWLEAKVLFNSVNSPNLSNLWKWSLKPLLILNMGGLVIATLKPAAVQPLLHTYLFNHQLQIKKIYYLGRDPFELIGHQVDFYRPLGLEVIPGRSFEAVLGLLNQLVKQPLKQPVENPVKKKNDDTIWLFYTHFELPTEAGELQKLCHLEFSVFPEWEKNFFFLPGIKLYSNKYSIFSCVNSLH